MFEVKSRDFDLPAMYRYSDRMMTGKVIDWYEQFGPIVIREITTGVVNGKPADMERIYYKTMDEGPEEFDYDFRVVIRG